MQYIDYPGRTRRESNKDKTPPGRIKIYLSRIQLEEFTPKVGATSEALLEKERIAAHSHERDNGAGNSKPGPPSCTSAAKPLLPERAKLQRPPNMPPLPPKGKPTMTTGSDSQGEQSRLRAFFSRARSD